MEEESKPESLPPSSFLLPPLRGDAGLPALFALAMMLALTQWTHHVLALALLSRAEKIRALAWIVGTTIALLLLADYGGRIGRWLKNRRQDTGTPLAPEGAER